jgi:Zn-dependent protease with chaperone function
MAVYNLDVSLLKVFQTSKLIFKMMILVPIASTLIQLAISISLELVADASGTRLAENRGL